MDENNNYNNDTIRPYKATINLNTVIGNPNANINNAMDVNIQNVTADSQNTNSIQNIPNIPYYRENTNNTPDMIQKNEIKKDEVIIPNIEKTNNDISVNNNSNINTNENTDYVKKVYITKDNKPKKKTTSLNMGPEFKIVLLIIVILLAFVLLLPMLNDLIMGY